MAYASFLGPGWWTIGKWHGAPVKLHWTVALGALVFGGFRFAPGAWVGFVVLVLIHELGHALVARYHRLRVVEIAVTGLGGYCAHEPGQTRLQASSVAWGGVWAQLAALVATLLLVATLGTPTSWFFVDLYHVFTVTNLFLIALNLLPFPPLDGAQAWPLVPLLWRRYRRRQEQRKAQQTDRKRHQAVLKEMEHLDRREQDLHGKSPMTMDDFLKGKRDE